MKISVWIAVTDLFPWNKTFFEKFFFDRIINKTAFQNGNLENIFARLKKSGVDGVELLVPPKLSKKEIDDTLKIFKKSSLPVLSIHQPLDPKSILRLTRDDLENLCIYAGELHARNITLHVASLGGQIKNRSFIEFLSAMQKKYGVIFGLENNHKHPLCLFQPYSWKEDVFADTVAKSGLGMTLDVTHLAQTGGSIQPFYEENKKRIVNIHMSDYLPDFLNQYLMLSVKTHLPLGQGQLPIIKLLHSLKKDNYKGLVTMEINSDLDGLCKSAELIKLHTS